ncbi:sodium:proton antiporter [Sulfolobus acidocaldarius SUSAZ]|nr:sodium:proton antiporter [Sulfolobus acidocaldarius SUSAZ]
MNTLEITLLDLGIMLILSKIAEQVFSRLGLIPFVGSIFVGIVLGEGVTNLIQVNTIISFISSLGIVFLLFLAGAEEINTEYKISNKLLFTTIIQIILPFLLIFLILHEVLNIPDYLVLIVPLIMTSAGPLTRLLIDLGISRNEVGANLFYQATLVEIISVILFSIFSQFNKNLLLVTLEIVLIFLLILILGPFITRVLEKIEGYIKVREVEFASIISLVLIIGFLAEFFNFNSAIAALFLGFLLRDYFKDRPDLLEKLHGFTYGFFEPLFFVSIGLFFVKINLQILVVGFILFLSVLVSKFLAGLISGKIMRNDPITNGLGTSTKGGVDVSLLISALTAGIITPIEYSYTTLAISLASLAIPLLFKLRTGYRVSHGERVKLNTKLSSLTNVTSTVFVSCDNTLREAILKINEKGVRALVVVDEEMRVVGLITVKTLLEISPDDYDNLRVCQVYLDDAEIIDEDYKVSDALRKFRESETPVIAVVDKRRKLKGTVYERELLRFLMG